MTAANHGKSAVELLLSQITMACQLLTFRSLNMQNENLIRALKNLPSGYLFVYICCSLYETPCNLFTFTLIEARSVKVLFLFS